MIITASEAGLCTQLYTVMDLLWSYRHILTRRFCILHVVQWSPMLLIHIPCIPLKAAQLGCSPPPPASLPFRRPFVSLASFIAGGRRHDRLPPPAVREPRGPSKFRSCWDHDRILTVLWAAVTSAGGEFLVDIHVFVGCRASSPEADHSCRHMTEIWQGDCTQVTTVSCILYRSLQNM